MHTATDSVRNGQVGPDYRSGYGLINAVAAVQLIDEAIITKPSIRTQHFWESTLTEGETQSFDFIAIGGAVKASLSWLDPVIANFNQLFDDRTPKLVNDLDIWFTDAQGNIYFPWTLDPENPAAAAKRDAHNRVDNFTQVLIDSVAADTLLTLHINDFGGLLHGTQDYALFVSGVLIPEPGSVLLILCAGVVLLRNRQRTDTRVAS